ncbi:hypothetical protein V1284_007671 [Nitrobacteraceae bacterium AZCC 2299]
MRKNGVIAISRKLFDPEDPFFGGEPFSRREAWQWLIAEAAWKPRKVNVGNGRGVSVVMLERGQLAHSKAFMQRAWGWSSEKTVRSFLDRLEIDGRILRRSGQPKGQPSSVVTICKYDEYQFGSDAEGQPKGSSGADHPEKTDMPSGQRTGQPLEATTDCFNDGMFGLPEKTGKPTGQPMGQPIAKNGQQLEEGLNNKRKNTRSRAGEPSGFENWYGAYPKKKSPKDAARAYAKLIASGEISEADLLARTVTFAAEWAKRATADRKFIPYPASWLNDGSYADEPDGKAAASPAAPPADPKTFSNERWSRMLDHHGRTGEWGQHWGPKPGTARLLGAPGGPAGA